MDLLKNTLHRLNSSFKCNNNSNIVLFKRKPLISNLEQSDDIITVLNDLIRNVLKTKYLIDRLNTIYILFNFINTNIDYIKKRFCKKNKKFLDVLLNRLDLMIKECIELEKDLGQLVELINCKNILEVVLASILKSSDCRCILEKN